MNRYLTISIIYICVTALIVSLFALSKNFNVLWLLILYFVIDKVDKAKDEED